MKCLLVFNNLNDIVFMKCNKHFMLHIRKLAKVYGMVSTEKADSENWFSLDLVIQLFSPLITSQKIMSNHFSNGYSSIQCSDGTNLAFDEYMGYLFVYISLCDVKRMRKVLSVCISVIKRVCGLDVSLLKSCSKRQKLVTFLLDTWFTQYNREQFMLVEAVEQLHVNSQLATSTLQALHDTVEKIKSTTEFTQIHALIMVNHRFLSLYSSRNAAELTPNDILFLSMLCDILDEVPFSDVNSSSCLAMYSDSDDNAEYDDTDDENENEDSETFYSPDGSHVSSHKTSMKSSTCSSTGSVHRSSGIGEDTLEYTNSFILFLGKQKPHIVHVSYISEGIPLFFIHEVGNDQVNISLSDALYLMMMLQSTHYVTTVDKDMLKKNLELADNAMKRLQDSSKKRLPQHISKIFPAVVKNLSKKWEPLRKKYQEYLKLQTQDSLLRLESPVETLILTLKNLYVNCLMDDSLIGKNSEIFTEAIDHVQKSLHHFAEFFRVKSTRNFTIGSNSTLSINKYLEEFPGLVHFLYIDRITHRLVAPSLDFSSEETVALTKRKIWWMVEFSRSYLQNGHLSLMWKDTVFSYSYFLWFEDSSSTPLKPKISPAGVLKSLPEIGILCGDFYQQLIEKCFPKTPIGKIRCFELYCIHLGLISSSCVLEHCRRLTATIWEVTGVSTNPLDLLF